MLFIAGSQTGKFKRAVLDKLGVEAAVRGEIDIFDENAVEQVADIVRGGGCVNIQRVVALFSIVGAELARAAVDGRRRSRRRRRERRRGRSGCGRLCSGRFCKRGAWLR